MYLPIPYKIQYDTSIFDFQKIVSNMLDVDNLYMLHEHKDYDLFTREKDQSSVWHSKYYSKFQSDFLETYLKLVNHLKAVFKYDSIVYQQIPTFRVQLANNLGVGEWHRDRTYNHGRTEVNFWMPFTDTVSSNCIWMESEEGREDFMPYNVKYGEILVFDGANLMHGNKINDSNLTRVSVDFRMVDPSKFVPNSAGSINMKTAFDIGGYFNQM